MNNTPILSELAALPAKTLIDDRTLAGMLRVSTRTISRWVQRGDIPTPARLGGRKLWMAGGLLAYVEQQIAAADTFTQRRKKEALKRAETP